MEYRFNYGLIVGMIGLFCCSAIFHLLWTWVGSAERFSEYRLRKPVNDPFAKIRKSTWVVPVIAFDISLYAAYLVLGYDWLIQSSAAVGFWTIAGQVLAVLLIYDFMFYWVHRLFHLPFLMRYVHGVHHRVRFPKAVDNFYLHPVDALWVTTLFFLSIAMVGPLSTTAFIVTLFVYVFINNTLHSGVNLPHPLFKLTNYWARMHDVHHGKNRSANFGSIFPIWDMLFGTHVRHDGA